MSNIYVKFRLHRTKLGILLLFHIIAIVLSLNIFVYFIKHRTSVKNLQNHGILILLTVNFIQLVFDMPNALAFYSRGYIHIYEHKYSSNRYQVIDLFDFRENIIFIKKNVFRLMKHINAIIMLKVYIYLNGNVLILKNI